MADKDYKFLTDSGLGRIISKALDPDSYSDLKDAGTGIYDLGAVPINKASEFLTGYNPGFSGSKFFGRKDDAGNLIDQDVAYFGVPTDATRGFDVRDKRVAAEKRRREVSKSRMMQNRLGDGEPEFTPSQLIDAIQSKKSMGGEEQRDYESRIRKSKDPKDYRQDKFKPEVKEKKEKFVPKDTVLGRIFDKRVREGEEISNRDKAFALLRNIGDNLSERRLVGGKEGTDTFSRIFGKSGGLREGMDEIETLEDEAIALRERGETKRAASIEEELKNKKTAYEIKKIDSEAIKNIAEAVKSNYSKATQQAMELATIRGFEPGTAAHMDETAAILSVAVTEGQAAIEGQITDLQNQLLTMDEDSDQAKALTARIDELRRKSIGTTVPSDAYDLPPADIDAFGKTKQS
tara:strand:- start:280 stop:1494 length:1215 start_codon:yes stop_codon:yes gene_type:complete